MTKTPQPSNNVKKDLDQSISFLIETGICDDANFSIIRPVESSTWEVTFTGAEHISIAYDDIDYAEIYSELAGKRSYNIKMIDGGLLQLMYLFKKDQLVKHRLAFYPSANLRTFQDAPDAYMRDELFLEITERRIVPFPVRFDFDNSAHIEVIHPQSHLTLGDSKCCRIPVTAPLTPRWFIEFIIRNFYHTDNLQFADNLHNHCIQFQTSITNKERGFIHLGIPQQSTCKIMM